MDTLKQKNTQEMENLWKESTALREQYQRLQHDHQTLSISTAVVHQNHEGETEDATRRGENECHGSHNQSTKQ